MPGKLNQGYIPQTAHTVMKSSKCVCKQRCVSRMLIKVDSHWTCFYSFGLKSAIETVGSLRRLNEERFISQVIVKPFSAAKDSDR